MAAAAETTSGEFLERDAELEAIGAAMAQARGGGGMIVVIDGPAGVGKTALVDAAREAAADAGLLTLSARGAELERDFAFGVMGQLFDPLLRAREADANGLFEGAARLAAPLLAIELDGVGPAVPEDPFAVRHALYWLTANLAAESRLAILIDDAHWADPASLEALAYIAHRLEGMPVSLVVATRTEGDHAALDAMRRLAGDRQGLLPVTPLGKRSTSAIVHSFAPSAGNALCRAVHEATGGNPFLVHELARSGLGAESRPTDVERILDRSPERVTREITARLLSLPDAAARLARAAAVLGKDVPLRQAAALAGLGQSEAVEAADVLVAAGMLGSAQPLEFLHPLVRAAVYAGLGEATQSREHARAARLLKDEAASPERIAAQLLRCQPTGDAWACDQLVAAARLASARGAGEAATKYLRRALAEPPPPEARAAILLELGAAESLALDAAASISDLREALAGELDAEERFRATMLLSGLLGHTYRIAEAVDVLEAQLEALADRPDLRTTAEAALSNVTRIDPQARPRGKRIVEDLRRRVEDGDESDPAVLGTVATELMVAGEPAERAARLAERALVAFDSAGGAASGWSRFGAARTLVIAERYDAALRVLNQTLEMARERGSLLDVGGSHAFRSELHLRVGDLTSAELDARTLNQIATEGGWTGMQGFATGWLGEVLVERGELDEAERLLEGADTADAPGGPLTRGYSAADVLVARARMRLARGRIDDGIDDLRAAGRWSIAIDNVNPAVVAWRSHLAHALLDLDRTKEARRLAAEELDLARAFGAPRALAIALRAAARVDGGEEEVRMLREAIDVLDGSPAQLERARVNAALGAAMHREGHAEEAREPLRLAVDLAHRCGANVVEDESLDELRATGARPRRRRTTGSAALTPSEQRIAELAAAGQQNREIAQALFVTTNTVEYHLRNAYRKLGIGSRAELADALEGASVG